MKRFFLIGALLLGTFSFAGVANGGCTTSTSTTTTTTTTTTCTSLFFLKIVKL